MNFFKENKKLLACFFAVAAALLGAFVWVASGAQTTGGGGVFLSLILALLVLNTVFCAVNRAESESGFLFIFLNVFTAYVFNLVLSSSYGVFASIFDGANPLNILNALGDGYFGVSATLLIYGAASMSALLVPSKKAAQRDLSGYVREAAVYIALAAVINVYSAVSAGALFLFFLSLYHKNKNGAKISAALFFVSFILNFVMYAVLYGLIPGSGARANPLGIAFYGAFVVLLALWLLLSLTAYKDFSSSPDAGKKASKLGFAACAIAFVAAAPIYIFCGVITRVFFSPTEGYLFMQLRADASPVMLYLIAAVLAVCGAAFVFLAAIAAANASKSKPVDKDDETPTTDELGISLAFDEDLKSKNIDPEEYARSSEAYRLTRLIEEESGETACLPLTADESAETVAVAETSAIEKAAAIEKNAPVETLAPIDLGVPIAMPYDFSRLSEKVAAKPEAADEESKKIDEILNRINKNIK
ncbi:MAG: hypothetical protein LBQ40_05510 [Clostridiales bacterium]|jgi:hypothetical protein|nr:hypothetical protein [Clostridiales bacterium]